MAHSNTATNEFYKAVAKPQSCHLARITARRALSSMNVREEE